jgi:16S rRNA (guanine1516-N2)-methyltransferase
MLKVIKEGVLLSTEDCQFIELNKFCSENQMDLVLEWHQGQYWLHSNIPKEKPIGIDIDATLTRHQDFFRQSSLHKELLARAIGVKGAFRPRVLDLTAGLLGDTLLLLAFGCEVWAVERHPVIRFLISSALQNARHPRLKALHFQAEESWSVLDQNLPLDVIYFDPMYEEVNHKTSPRKEMRIFRSIVGQDQDAGVVLQKALSKKVRRLVVKRPRKSPSLGPRPSVEYIGKSTRYDAYFPVD